MAASTLSSPRPAAAPRAPTADAAPPTPGPSSAPDALATAWALHAALLGGSGLAEGAGACARALAQGLGASLAWVALADGLRLELVALSDGQDPAAPSPRQARLLAAAAETFDQARAVQWPEPAAGEREGDGAGAVAPITRAHAALAEVGLAAVCSVPLVAGGRCIGAWGIGYASAASPAALPSEPLRWLEDLGCLLGPVFVMLQAQARPWHRRLRDDLRRWWQAEHVPWRRPLRRSVPAIAVGLLAASLWPVPMPVGGHARLEGAVQRVLVAPSDGFVQQVHVRPGQAVQAGAPLLDLADQDLQLERQRWQSQLAQHLDALAAAQARSDRAQLVQMQSKADEAQAQLDLVDERLQRSRLVAPFDAVVVQGDLSQQLGAPIKLGAELMTLAPRDRFRVIVEVDERDIARIRLGQTGSVALSALPWDTQPLRVARISPVAAAVEGRNVFEVEAELLQSAAGLRPGLQGTARIVTDEAPTLWRWTRRLLASLRLAVWEWFA